MKFDSKSTTDQVLDGIDLSGKNAIVTGASGGLGEETARALAAHGADVTLAARSREKLRAAASRIKASSGQDVEVGVLELDKPDSVRAFALDWLARHDRLDILVNNAGVMMCPLTRTAEGWELQFATNHLGHFLLTNLLVPALKRAGSARVVSVASAGHNMATVDFNDVNYDRRSYSAVDAYGQSKTATIWFANELDRRLKRDGIRAFSLHPGGINTDLGRHLTPEIYQQLMEIIETRGGGEGENKTPGQGAATSCWAATSPELADKGGLYLADCAVAAPGDHVTKNHAPWAYDETAEGRLWNLSNEMLGTEF